MTATAPDFNLLQSTRVRFSCASIVFFIAIVLYARTLAPTVTLVDSGELIVAARTLGVAHPPGFPLYVLLAHLATLLPIGNIAARVNFASALFAALAAAGLTLVVAEAMLTSTRLALRKDKSKKRDARGKRSKKPAQSIKDSDEAESSIGFRWITALAPCLAAGLLFAFSRTLWAYATIAEVYTLNTLLIVVIVFLMFRWRRESIEDQLHDGRTKPRDAFDKHDKWLNLAALAFGLAQLPALTRQREGNFAHRIAVLPSPIPCDGKWHINRSVREQAYRPALSRAFSLLFAQHSGDS